MIVAIAGFTVHRKMDFANTIPAARWVLPGPH